MLSITTNRLILTSYIVISLVTLATGFILLPAKNTSEHNETLADVRYETISEDKETNVDYSQDYSQADINSTESDEVSYGADEMGKYLETLKEPEYELRFGDIMVLKSELATFNETDLVALNHSSKFMAAIPSSRGLWDARGVPVYVDRNFPPNTRRVIVDALNHIQDHTCIRFRNAVKADTPSWKGLIHFKPGNEGCFSYIGRVGGAQTVNLNPRGCSCVGTAVHETMHALGFYHEQSRSDRDEYVTIVWQNIQNYAKNNFEKLSPRANKLFTEYDYYSLMHYPENAFARNWGQKTIIPKRSGVRLTTECSKRDLTKLDAIKINKLYLCEDYLNGNKPSSRPPPFVLQPQW